MKMKDKFTFNPNYEPWDDLHAPTFFHRTDPTRFIVPLSCDDSQPLSQLYRVTSFLADHPGKVFALCCVTSFIVAVVASFITGA